MKDLLKRLYRPSPFKAGLVITLVIFTLHPHAFVTWSNRGIKDFIDGMDDRIHDFMFIIRGKETNGELTAAVIDIDEKSLKELGQWPWPRTRMATLIRNLHRAAPKAIGFDVVFSESDRTSLKHKVPDLATLTGHAIKVPPEYDEDGWLREEEEVTADYHKVFQSLLKLPKADFSKVPYDNDRVLAKAIRDCPTTVLGYFWLTTDDGLLDPENPPAPIGSSFIRQTLPGYEFRSPFKNFATIPYRPILNLEMLEDAADDRAGCFNAAFLAAGTVRRVPLVWEYGENIYPTLALQMLRVAVGEQQGIVTFDDYGVDRVRLPSKGISIRADRVAQVYVNFRGRQRTFDYISAVDVIRNQFDPSLVKGKYLFVGSSAGGLMDLRSIAFEKAYPGVEVHANVIDNILKDDYLTQPRDAFVQELILILILGLLTAALLAYTKPLVGMPLSALLIVGIVCANY
ncbi:MAG: CHASE2 domain-containing protein, partial [Planctomycetota bacterium]